MPLFSTLYLLHGKSEKNCKCQKDILHCSVEETLKIKNFYKLPKN